MDVTVFEKVRLEKDLTKAKVCRLAKIKEPTYDAIIYKKSSPKVVILERVCKALEISPARLWDNDNQFINEPAPLGYKKICTECEKKEKQIEEHLKTIENLNYCLEHLKERKKKGNETPFGQ